MATSFDFAWKMVLGWLLGRREDIAFETEREVGQLLWLNIVLTAASVVGAIATLLAALKMLNLI